MHEPQLPAGFDEFALVQTPQLFALARAMTGDVHDAWQVIHGCDG